MRIAIIGPNFTHGLTYQENMWAEHLTRLGHAVRMLHAGHVTTAPRLLTESYGSFQEQQVHTRYLPRSTFSSRGLADAVAEFRPELIVVHGDKLFAKHVMLDERLANVPLIATFSENAGMHEYDWRKPGISARQRAWAMGFRLMRAGPIRLTCRRAAMLIGNTPQARDILLSLFDDPRERELINRKIVDIPLGFSPEAFRYQPVVRTSVRAELGIADDQIIACASSHLDAVKAQYMIRIIDALRLAMNQCAELRGLIIGFAPESGNAASQRVANHITAGPFAERFIPHNFAAKARLSQLYNASDIAVFGRASISCQEALGTGLIGCFADDGSTRHLVKTAEQAVFFRPGDNEDKARQISSATSLIKKHSTGRDELRLGLAGSSRWLGYDQIIAAAMAEAQRRIHT